MPEDKPLDPRLERRTEQPGLPTDPEAYQDGGLAKATCDGMPPSGAHHPARSWIDFAWFIVFALGALSILASGIGFSLLSGESKDFASTLAALGFVGVIVTIMSLIVLLVISAVLKKGRGAAAPVTAAEKESDGPGLPSTGKRLSGAIGLLFISLIPLILAVGCLLGAATRGGGLLCMGTGALLVFALLAAAGIAALRSWHESLPEDSLRGPGDAPPSLSLCEPPGGKRPELIRDPEYERYLEQRAEQQGLPTDPEAYPDGELAVLMTVYEVQEAEVIVALLRNEEIPAWIEGEHMAAWNWHLQLGLHPGGIRIMVPLGRLKDAKESLEQQQMSGDELRAMDPPEHSEYGPDYQLYRSAQRLGYLLITGIFDPIAFFLAIRLLKRIRRRAQEAGPSPDLEKAQRLAWGIILLAWPLWILLFGAGSALVAAF